MQTDRYGKITFDATKFASAYTADPDEGRRQARGRDLAARRRASRPGWSRGREVRERLHDGALTQTITGRQSSVTTMQDSIADWDIRLRRARTR